TATIASTAGRCFPGDRQRDPGGVLATQSQRTDPPKTLDRGPVHTGAQAPPETSGPPCLQPGRPRPARVATPRTAPALFPFPIRLLPLTSILAFQGFFSHTRRGLE